MPGENETPCPTVVSGAAPLVDAGALVCSPEPETGALCADVQLSGGEPMSTTTESATLPRLLTARQVAEATGIPVARLYELTRTGDLPHTRLGRTVRYAAPALRDWIDRGGTGEWESP